LLSKNINYKAEKGSIEFVVDELHIEMEKFNEKLMHFKKYINKNYPHINFSI